MISSGQIGTTFNDAQQRGINMSHLDSIYKSGAHIDSTKAAFAGHEEEFFDSWKKMLVDFATFLKKNGFKWNKPTKCFNRIYFKNDGSIVYFLYNFRSGEIDESKEKEFNSLLNEFIKTYKFPMTNKVNFSQCGSVSYTD